MQLTLSEELDKPLRVEVAKVGFRIKDRRLRLMLMRSLITYPEYEYRLTQVRYLTKAQAKLHEYNARQTQQLFEELQFREKKSILRDMRSAFEIAEAILKCKYKLNIDMKELRKHVSRQIF